MNDFVVHDEGDSVGVVVVEGVEAGDQITGWIMDQDKEIRSVAARDIPIGHKPAIHPLKTGDTVIQYGSSRIDSPRAVLPAGVAATGRAAGQTTDGEERNNRSVETRTPRVAVRIAGSAGLIRFDRRASAGCPSRY